MEVKSTGGFTGELGSWGRPAETTKVRSVCRWCWFSLLTLPPYGIPAARSRIAYLILDNAVPDSPIRDNPVRDSVGTRFGTEIPPETADGSCAARGNPQFLKRSTAVESSRPMLPVCELLASFRQS
ncbi:hypothetical protein GCM10009618_15270 [Nesterenkonia lacusekhoensis]